MMHLFLNGLAASAGAGLTYIRNVVPHLSARNGLRTTIALSSSLRHELGNPPNVSFLELPTAGALRRFWQEQTLLPKLIRNSGAQVLISAGNFAIRNSPVSQILLSGNSLYTSSDFYRDLRTRGAYGLWLDTHVRGILAKRSIAWADCTVAPSEAFAVELGRWTGARNVVSIYHGFDHDAFFRDNTPMPPDIAQKLFRDGDALRLLFVSHYNYYRNFETLLRAVPLLRQRLAPRKLKLFLSCKLSSDANPGSYRAEAASALVRQLGISDQVVELGTIPYHLLHQAYRSCNIYVTPAYAETFAHPLVEAMSCGLPVVASDLAVHHEVCGPAALYFPRFSPDDLASRVMEVAGSPELSFRMAASGTLRSLDFSWSRHVDQILSVATDLLATRVKTASVP